MSLPVVIPLSWFQAEVQYTVKVQLYSQSIAHGNSKVPLTQVTGADGVVFTFYEYVFNLLLIHLIHVFRNVSVRVIERPVIYSKQVLIPITCTDIIAISQLYTIIKWNQRVCRPNSVSHLQNTTKSRGTLMIFPKTTKIVYFNLYCCNLNIFN